MNWWNDLSSLQQIFTGIAIPATLVMLLQIVLFIIGAAEGGSGDADVSHATDFHVQDLHSSDLHAANGGMNHHDTAAVKLFTIRSIVAFFAIGGWAGVVTAGLKFPVPAVFTIAFLVGWAALYFVTWAIRLALRMQSSGNVQIENAVGKTGEVYITVPAAGKGFGKINVIVQERLREYDAQTEAERELKTGETVQVTRILNDEVLLVMPQDRLETAE